MIYIYGLYRRRVFMLHQCAIASMLESVLCLECFKSSGSRRIPMDGSQLSSGMVSC